MEFFDYENDDDILKTARNIYQNQLNKEVAAIKDAYYKPNGISNTSFNRQIKNAYVKHLKRVMPTIRNSNSGSLEQLRYLKDNSPKAFNMINTMAQGLGTTPDKIMSYYNNEEFMKAFGPNKVRFIKEELKGLDTDELIDKVKTPALRGVALNIIEKGSLPLDVLGTMYEYSNLNPANKDNYKKPIIQRGIGYME